MRNNQITKNTNLKTMKKNNIFKTLLMVCVVLSFLPLCVQNATAQCINAGSSGDQITNEENSDEIYYKLWNGKGGGQTTIGTACITLGDGFKFSSTWTNTDNTLARRGYRFNETQTHSQLGHYTLAYNCDYNPNCSSGNSYLSIYGWTYDASKSSPDDLVEYYIIENWCNWNPSMATSNKTDMGNITVNGATYKVIKVIQYGKPSIKDGSSDDFVQYFSVRDDKRSFGTIDISEHFKQWEDKGLSLGKFYEITMVVEGYQNSGSASFSKLDFGYSRGPQQDNNATSVSFGQSTYSILQGTSSSSLLGQWLPAGSTLSNLYIESSNPNVASIGVYKGNYFVHGENTGTATLTLMSGTTPNATATVTVTGTSFMMVSLNAQGTTGTEKIALMVDGNPMKILSLTNSLQTYNEKVAGTGDVTVEFLNDDGIENGRDVRLDYIMVDGVKRETEAMAANSAAYENGICGGGSYTEWLHCNGDVNYGPVATNHTITIRARGAQGGEHIDLLINGNPVNQGWWLGTSYQEYTATVTGDGDINVEYDNDGGSKDVIIDWIKVDNQIPRQAENMEYNTGAYANGQCGGGSYTQWLHCNGVIGFGMISDNFKSVTQIENANDNRLSSLNIFPNPSTGEVTVELGNVNMNACVKVLDYTGKLVFMKNNMNDNQLQINNLKTGMYIVTVTSNDIVHSEKLIVE